MENVYFLPIFLYSLPNTDVAKTLVKKQTIGNIANSMGVFALVSSGLTTSKTITK